MIMTHVTTFTNNEFYEFGEDEMLPTYSWRGMTIISKKNRHVYEFVKSINVKDNRFKELDYAMCTYAEFRLVGTENTKPFIFITVEGAEPGKPLGVIVSDQLFNYRPTMKVVNVWREAIGIEKINREKDLFLDIIKDIQRIFKPRKYEIEVQPNPDDKRRIALGSKKVQEEWERLFGNDQLPKYIIPDFVLYELKRCKKQSFIEVERKKRNEKVIMMKLWKLHYLDRKVFFIFQNEQVQEHYISIIIKFEKETGRKFKSLHYLTVEELKMIAWKETSFNKYSWF
jgi:hypothetical protein